MQLRSSTHPETEFTSMFVRANDEALENFKLRQALTEIWEDHALNENFRVQVLPCRVKELINIEIFAKGELYTPNQELVDRLVDLADEYDFDMLEAWPDAYGNIMFLRRSGDIIQDLMADAEGKITDMASTGFCSGDEDFEFGGQSNVTAPELCGGSVN